MFQTNTIQKHSEVQPNHSSLQTFSLRWLYQNITNALKEKNTKCMLETHQFYLSLYALTIKSFVAISANDAWQKMSIKVFIERENTGERFSVNKNVRTGSMMSVCRCILWSSEFGAEHFWLLSQHSIFFFNQLYTPRFSPVCTPSSTLNSSLQYSDQVFSPCSLYFFNKAPLASSSAATESKRTSSQWSLSSFPSRVLQTFLD